MKQRVSIARGLVQDPPVLLMDEPFAALDEQTRMTMGHELLRIWSQTAKTVVFVTHSLTEAVYLADEVLVMSARPGRIIDRIAIDLPRPRTYEMMATDVFGRLRDRIWQQIRKAREVRCAAPPPSTVRWLILAALLVFWELMPRTGHHPRAVPAVAVEDARGAGEGLARIRLGAARSRSTRSRSRC